MYPLQKDINQITFAKQPTNVFVNCTYIFQTSLPLRFIDMPVSPFDRILYDRVSSHRGVTETGQCAMRVLPTYSLSVKFSLPFLAGL